MLDTLEDMGYDVERLRPEGKDWNDDLRAKRKRRQHKAVGVNSFIQHQLPIQRLLC